MMEPERRRGPELALFFLGFVFGSVLVLLGIQLLDIAPLYLAQGGTQPSALGESPVCVSTARQFSVLRFERERVNKYHKEVQDFVVHGLRAHGVDVNTPTWPGCLDQPLHHPASCLGRMCVITFVCTNRSIGGDHLARDTLRTVNAGHHTTLIHFNLEVIMDAHLMECHADPVYEPMWRQSVVWDYSSQNVASLARLGLSPPAGHTHPARPAVVNLSFYPNISGSPADDDCPPRLERFHEPYDYDVLLLMGLGPTPRRKIIIDALRERNLTVLRTSTAWGAERIALVRRSAILLNMHQFDTPLVEAPRLVFLLSLGATVLSEDTTDLAAREYWAEGVEFVPYHKLADAAVRLVANATRRYELAMAGYQLVRRRNARDNIRDPLTAALDWTNTPYSLHECPSPAP